MSVNHTKSRKLNHSTYLTLFFLGVFLFSCSSSKNLNSRLRESFFSFSELNQDFCDDCKNLNNFENLKDGQY